MDFGEFEKSSLRFPSVSVEICTFKRMGFRTQDDFWGAFFDAGFYAMRGCKKAALSPRCRVPWKLLEGAVHLSFRSAPMMVNPCNLTSVRAEGSWQGPESRQGSGFLKPQTLNSRV